MFRILNLNINRRKNRIGLGPEPETCYRKQVLKFSFINLTTTRVVRILHSKIASEISITLSLQLNYRDYVSVDCNARAGFNFKLINYTKF